MFMTYSSDNLAELNKKYLEIGDRYDKLLIALSNFQRKLKNEKAREYLMQGVGRRLKTLTQCIKNIFTIFPPHQNEHLSKEMLTDIDINLHAFFINLAGVIDNLAWIFVYENNLLGKSKDGKIPRASVGLFKNETQKHLKTELMNYLNSDSIKSWHEHYSKDYRDALAHRVPLYVPPSTLTEAEEKEYHLIEHQIQKLGFNPSMDFDKHRELSNKQKSLGRASHFFAHSSSEGSRPIYFHAQVLADYATIEEIIDSFVQSLSH
jgi:hypothetical protein